MCRDDLVSVNATLGNGRPNSSVVYNAGENTILGVSRLALFKEVAKAGAKDGWPLWIPTPARVFVSCNISAENSGPEAERFITDGFLRSVKNLLAKPGEFIVESEDKRVIVEGEIPLSLLDARLWVGACSRLPAVEKSRHLEKVLDIVNGALGRYDKDGRTLVSKRGISSFLGRLVTTIIHLTTLVGSSVEYEKIIRNVLPDLMSRCLTIWVSSEKYLQRANFMGLASSWESSDITDGGHITTNGALPGVLFPKVRLLIETAFALGFESLASDCGHLLFAAWNAHGRLALWNPMKDELAIPKLSVDNPTVAILAIRSDVCLVQRRIRVDQGTMAKSGISKALERGQTPSSPRTIVDNLRTLIRRGNESIHKIVDSYAEESKNTISIEECALLQSLALCVSFGISMLTIPESSFFAELSNDGANAVRIRSYSTDSEMESNGSHDPRMNASERLAEVCRELEAVPAHPDWLDLSCQLRYGTTRAEARELAANTISALTKVVKFGVQARNDAVKHCLGITDPPCSELFVQLTSLLFNLSGDVQSANTDIVVGSIANLCTTSDDITRSLAYGLNVSLQTLTADFWCQNAAQHIIGDMHDLIQNEFMLPSEISTAELRATGDWEIALSTALLSGVCDSDADSDMNIIHSHRWTEMLTLTLQWMVPACALLNYASNGTGLPHPLKAPDCSIDDYFSQMDNAENTKALAKVALTESTRQAVLELLCLVARPLLSNEAVSQTLAIHLLGFTDNFQVVAHAGRLVSVVQILDALLGRSAAEEQVDDLCRIISCVFDCMRRNAKSSEWLITRLLFACSHNTKFDINSLILGSFEVTDIVLSELSRWSGNITTNVHLSSFTLEAVSVFCQTLCYSPRLPIEALNFCATILSSISIIERDGRVGSKLSRMILQRLSDKPILLFEHQGVEEFFETNLLWHHLANIYAIPFFSKFTHGLSKFSTELIVCLRDIVNDSSKDTLPAGVLNLWFLAATFTTDLEQIGVEIFKGNLDERDRLQVCHAYMRFVSNLALVLSKQPGEMPKRRVEGDDTERKVCTFKATEGYQEQHWYNCRTCGLTGDKGSCSVCAQICHEGHDIVYSRYSSFFCDCGSDSSQSRTDTASVRCKCLVSAPRDTSLLLPETRPEAFFEGSNNISDGPSCTEVAASLFREKAQKALKRVRGAISKYGWVDTLSSAVTEVASRWGERALSDTPSRFSPSTGSKGPAFSGDSLNDFDIFNSSRATILNTAPVPTSERLCDRSVMASDDRGRFVLCEGAFLRFWTVSSTMNKTFAEQHLAFSRREIPFLASVNHEIVGTCNIMLSSFNGHHLLVWSQKAVVVFAINESWTGVSKRQQLLRQDESSSSVVRCGFLPGVEGLVFIASKHGFVVHRVKSDCSEPVLKTTLPESLSMTFKDFLIVPIYQGYTVSAWKVICLMQSGRLFEASFTVNELKDASLNLEYMTVTGMPEEDKAQRIDFLEHSGLLIIQYAVAGVMAVRFENGKARFGFKLLESGPVNTQNSSVEVTGPYSHWHSYDKMDDNTGDSTLCLLFAGNVAGSSNSVVMQILVSEYLSLSVSRVFVGPIEAFVICCLPTFESDRKPYDFSFKRTVSDCLVLSIISSGSITTMVEHGAYESFSRTIGLPSVFIFEDLVKAWQPAFQVDGIR